jgi:MoxR-like ATPase
MANFILADEINRTPPKTQASLLEAMEERQVTVDGNTYKLPRPFMVMATQNPVEYLGTFPLPEAQIDRFLMRITMGYPTPEDECGILERNIRANPLDALMPVAEAADIVRIQEEVKTVHIDRSVNEYIVSITGKTRAHPDVALGASIRGTLNLGRASQAYAFYSGRMYVTPDDVKKMAEPVLSHRLMLKQEAKLKKVNPQIVIKSIIESVKVPVVDRHVEK